MSTALLPDRIKIGGVDYTVEQVDGLRDGNESLNGWIQYNECKILVDAGLSPQRQRIVIWHEVVHGLLEHAGIEEDRSEHMVVALGYGIVQALRDNPWLGENDV